MDDPNGYPSVRKRFPEWSEQIGQLSKQDPDLKEACSDYEELSNWLARHDHELCPPESACALNRLILADLEVEILRYLQTARRQPGRQA